MEYLNKKTNGVRDDDHGGSLVVDQVEEHDQVDEHVHEDRADRESLHVVSVSPEADFVLEGERIEDAVESGDDLEVSWGSREDGGDDQQCGVGLQEHRFDVIEIAVGSGAHRLLDVQHRAHLVDQMSLEEPEGLEGDGEREFPQRVVDGHEVLVHQHELVHLRVGGVGARVVVEVEVLHLRRDLSASERFREGDDEQMEHGDPVADDDGRGGRLVRLRVRREGEGTRRVDEFERRFTSSEIVMFGL